MQRREFHSLVSKNHAHSKMTIYLHVNLCIKSNWKCEVTSEKEIKQERKGWILLSEAQIIYEAM
jgi:hypothetical protein